MSEPQIPSSVGWHTLTIRAVAEAIGTDSQTGLSIDEATRRLDQYGPNVIPSARQRSRLQILLDLLKSLVVLLLLAAGGIALLTEKRPLLMRARRWTSRGLRTARPVGIRFKLVVWQLSIFSKICLLLPGVA